MQPIPMDTAGDALGMVETKGFIGSVEAADAMVKAANVTSSAPNTSARATSPCSCAAMSAR